MCERKIGRETRNIIRATYKGGRRGDSCTLLERNDSREAREVLSSRLLFSLAIPYSYFFYCTALFDKIISIIPFQTSNESNPAYRSFLKFQKLISNSYWKFDYKRIWTIIEEYSLQEFALKTLFVVDSLVKLISKLNILKQHPEDAGTKIIISKCKGQDAKHKPAAHLNPFRPFPFATY